MTGINLPWITATVVAGGRTLPEPVASRIERVVVDADLRLPGMFEIAFADYDGTALSQAGIEIGTAVEVWSNSLEQARQLRLITGEVTALEGLLHSSSITTVVRGYTTAHRLQRARRTRTFLNMTDSDIAVQLAVEAGLEPGLVEPTATAFEYLAQVNQTDWEFLTGRATEIGYELGVADGTFYFRPMSTVDRPATPVPVPLGHPKDLLGFRPRLTAGNLATGVEVRVWDPVRAEAIAVPATLASQAGAPFTPVEPGLGAVTGTTATRYLGPEPATTAFVVSDRPLATGSATRPAAEITARGLADQVGGTCAEAEGEAIGNAAIQPGVVLEVIGVQARFDGPWLVTRTTHVFDDSEYGYRTSFAAHGAQDRSLLGLTSRAVTRGRIDGVVCGIVSNCADPLAQGRVKAVLPWLSPSFETDWAPVVQFGAGARSGSCFLPEVGDEVLLAFELADPRRPYVFGGLVNDHTTWDLGAPAVAAGDVVRRGFMSGSGNGLVFSDELPPPPAAGPAATSAVRLGSTAGEVALSLDQVACTAALRCDPVPGTSAPPAGKLTIGSLSGQVTVSASPAGAVTIDGGAALVLKATTSIDIESQGVVTIKGLQIRLN
ncbi:VgrG-related protein [Amycolatopsis sp. cg5]|uniref:VgrG-related protein n=1 Tax=Amycolatopsis sp. cg5 TaxID=3238802 RepID=UPI003525F7E1